MRRVAHERYRVEGDCQVDERVVVEVTGRHKIRKALNRDAAQRQRAADLHRGEDVEVAGADDLTVGGLGSVDQDRYGEHVLRGGLRGVENSDVGDPVVVEVGDHQIFGACADHK